MLAGIAGLLAQRVRHRSAAAHELALPACWRGNPVDDFLFGRLALKRDTLKETDLDSLGSSTFARSAIGERCVLSATDYHEWLLLTIDRSRS